MIFTSGSVYAEACSDNSSHDGPSHEVKLAGTCHSSPANQVCHHFHQRPTSHKAYLDDASLQWPIAWGKAEEHFLSPDTQFSAPAPACSCVARIAKAALIADFITLRAQSYLGLSVHATSLVFFLMLVLHVQRIALMEKGTPYSHALKCCGPDTVLLPHLLFMWTNTSQLNLSIN